MADSSAGPPVLFCTASMVIWASLTVSLSYRKRDPNARILILCSLCWFGQSSVRTSSDVNMAVENYYFLTSHLEFISDILFLDKVFFWSSGGFEKNGRWKWEAWLPSLLLLSYLSQQAPSGLVAIAHWHSNMFVFVCGLGKICFIQKIFPWVKKICSNFSNQISELSLWKASLYNGHLERFPHLSYCFSLGVEQ